MIEELITYWNRQFATLPLDEFLNEAMSQFNEGLIGDELMYQLHAFNQLEEQQYKGYLENEEYVKQHKELSKETLKTVQKINKFLLPILPAKAKAGESVGQQYSIMHQEIKEWKHIKKGRVSNSIGIRIQGDSMEPEYMEGDIVICKKVFSPPKEESTMVVVTKENNIFLKKVFIDQTSEKVRLRSLNSKYESFELSDEEVYDFWSVEQKLKI